jgi:hypothetical protein
LGFFFAVFADALIGFARWIFPGGGWRLGSIIFAAGFCVLEVFEIDEKGLA